MSIARKKLSKILIVEDEKMIASAYKKGFGAAGYAVVTAQDGADGFEKAEKELPDIIFLDIIMPGTDGLTFLRNLRASEWGKNIPVIVLTNSSDPARAAEVQRLGVSDFLLKAEWSMGQLMEKVNTRLGAN
ncbi:MAG TPA: response regulator [Patescibacteria group bacterium]|nr:response regulator [Patescibacteria group bacterium]